MRSDGYSTLCVCLSTVILALQDMGWPMSDTSGFRTRKTKKAAFPKLVCIQQDIKWSMIVVSHCWCKHNPGSYVTHLTPDWYMSHICAQ